MKQKKVLIGLILLMFIFTFVNTSFAIGIENMDNEPSAMLPRDKTVVVNYANFDDIKQTFYSKEYDDNDEGWWIGTLNYYSSKVLPSGVYSVTYKGKVYFSY